MDENIAKVYVTGVVGEDATLLSVIRQVNSFANPTMVEVEIDSQGGYVDEGKAIYDYLKGLEIPVRTIAKRAYSIAAHIFMAGEEREVEKGEGRVMIHFPFVSQMTGRSDDLRKMSDDLKALEEEFVTFYSEFVKADEKTIRRLLETETFLSADEAFDLGIATHLSEPFPMKAVAYVDETQNKNIIMKNAEKLIKALKSFVEGSSDEAEVKALVLQDANGVEIEFPELDSDAEPTVGDKATVENAPADGEYVSPSGETWVFSGGELTEVRPAEDTEETPEEGEEEASTNEDSTEETQEAEAEVEAEVDFEQLLEQLFAKAKKEATEETEAKANVKIEALEAELKSVKKLLGSADLDTQEREDREDVEKPKTPLKALANRRKRK